jgi:hypothetical protein
MKLDRILQVLHRRLGEVDPALASTMEDDELVQYLLDARDILELKGIGSMDSLVLQPDLLQPSYGFTPEPTLAQGMIMTLHAAVMALEDMYRGRLFRGELGIAWQSGLESESTISAEKAYRDAIGAIRNELTTVWLVQAAGQSGSRIQ